MTPLVRVAGYRHFAVPASGALAFSGAYVCIIQENAAIALDGGCRRLFDEKVRPGMCRVVNTQLIDQETVYAPRQGNDRLLMGLKVRLNEYELDLLRQPSLSARYEEVWRGDLVVAAPVGFVSVGDWLEKDADRRVQTAIGLAIDKVAALGSVRHALL